MPRATDVAVEISVVVIVDIPIPQIIEASVIVAFLVEDMRVDMSIVAVARIGFERAFNVLARQVKLADLRLGESVLAKEPPVVAVVRRDVGRIGKLLCFASFAAAKSNEDEDAGAGLRDHDVAGIFHDMGADCLVTARSVAIDEPAKSFGVGDFAFALTCCVSGILNGSRCAGSIRHQNAIPRDSHMRHCQIRIGFDGPAKRFFHPALPERTSTPSIYASHAASD